jgi:hypothetical protein
VSNAASQAMKTASARLKILIGCDVDPIAPSVDGRPSGSDIWRCIDHLERLIGATKGGLPPITWLIRADESVRVRSGDFASGYTSRRALWQILVANGHELGWHMHCMSFDPQRGGFAFDPDPKWLAEAWQAISACYPVRSVRTGWDFASNALFRQFEQFGITVDFSAIPGGLAWHSVGSDRFVVDWSRCGGVPYHPSPDDYQTPGPLNLLEIPLAQFPNSIVGMAGRLAKRLANGSASLSGLRNVTRTMADPWTAMPASPGGVWALYFHMRGLAGAGLDHFLRNLDCLRGLPDAEFVTASAAREFLARAPADGRAAAAAAAPICRVGKGA